MVCVLIGVYLGGGSFMEAKGQCYEGICVFYKLNLSIIICLAKNIAFLL